MIENNWAFAFIPLAIGAITGLAYLGFLWISINKLIRGKRPIPLALLGFFLRLGTLGICLIFIAKWFQLVGILCYLSGFFIVKKIAQRKYGYHH